MKGTRFSMSQGFAAVWPLSILIHRAIRRPICSNSQPKSSHRFCQRHRLPAGEAVVGNSLGWPKQPPSSLTR